MIVTDISFCKGYNIQDCRCNMFFQSICFPSPKCTTKIIIDNYAIKRILHLFDRYELAFYKDDYLQHFYQIFKIFKICLEQCKLTE